MSSNPKNSHTVHSHDPWLHFTQRNEQIYRFEDVRLCGPNFPLDKVIDTFMAQGYKNFARAVPPRLRYQVLNEFLRSELPPGVPLSVSEHVRLLPVDNATAALLEDRHNHGRCMRLIQQACSDDKLYAENLSVHGLYDSLLEAVRCHRDNTSDLSRATYASL